MILLIDTTPEEFFQVGLATRGGALLKSFSVPGSFHHAEKLLPAIAALLKRAKKKFTDLTEVAVIKGPGGYTAIRMGVVTANAIGFALGIPVIGFLRHQAPNLASLAAQASALARQSQKRSQVTPFYEHEPTITISKKPFF